MNQRTFLAFVAALSLGAGCDSSTAPYSDVETRLEVDPTRAAMGDVIELRAIATNRSRKAVQFFAGCGQGLDFEVQRPSGDRRFILRELPSTCPIFDSNILEPAETDTVSYSWTVPQERGTYQVWAGGRVPEGLAARSAPVAVVVN
jgi:hypothetical protein